MNKGKLILIPTTLGEVSTSENIAELVKKQINNCEIFIVEKTRSARRFLKKAGITKPIDKLIFFEINKRTNIQDIPFFLKEIENGKNIGILSEAGCPGIADPGSEVVKLAHKKNIEVIPLAGPSSILLSLMASGMNGQNFSFIGYLPIEKRKRRNKIKEIETYSKQNNQTQIFIETPFRNNQLLEELSTICSINTEIVVACDLTLPSQYIKRLKSNEWKNENINLHKRPTIFLLHKY